VKIAFLFLLVLLGSWFAGQWINSRVGTGSREGEIIFHDQSACELLKSECEFRQLEKNYRIKFIEKPSPLTPFTLQLKTENLQPDAVEISFEMEGMDMGYAVYQMYYDPILAVWQTKATLPVCSLGRGDWVLKTSLGSAGEWAVTEFRFLLE